MAKTALGISAHQIDEISGIFSVNGSTANVNTSFEITDVVAGNGKIIMEFNFDSGLKVIDALTNDTSMEDKNDVYMLIEDGTNNLKVLNRGLDFKISKYYDNTILTIQLNVLGKQGGKLGKVDPSRVGGFPW